jgi:hypothetical protein
VQSKSAVDTRRSVANFWGFPFAFIITVMGVSVGIKNTVSKVPAKTFSFFAIFIAGDSEIVAWGLDVDC